ncbi:MAG: GspL/Epsl periplasmic domain-containing protein [Thermodesulfobacteriota bacterium]|nr:GspL/Epsl periplasmic domain-containing protein [Thermodesulfobacteriota bacterium]
MPGKILGLDIGEDAITGVQVKSVFNVYQVMACTRVTFEHYQGLDNALKELSDKIDVKSDICLASIPGGHASYRNLYMPFREPGKIAQTLPFEIETMVPFSIDDLLVDFTVVDREEQSAVLAVSLEKALISEYLAGLNTHGIDPEVVDIRGVPAISLLLKQEGTPDNGLLLEIGEQRTTMVLYLNRRIALIRTLDIYGDSGARTIPEAGIDSSLQNVAYLDSLCVAVRNTIHAFAWQNNREVRFAKIYVSGIRALHPETGNILNRYFDLPSEQINLSRDKRIRMDENIARVWNPALMDGALALALRGPGPGRGFNFRKGEFATKKRRFGLSREFRKAAAFIMVVLVFLIADLAVDFYFLKKRYRALDRQVTDVFKRTFPDVKRIVDPLQQMKVKINEIKNSAFSHPGIEGDSTALDLIRHVSLRIPESLDVRVTRMVIDPDTVRISGNTDTFNTVDNIKNGLESSACFSSATISSANLERLGRRVGFEIKLQRSR